jgi:uncharacterized protein YkwD
VLLRRFAPIALALSLLAPSAPAVAAADLTVAQAEARVVAAFNALRTRGASCAREGTSPVAMPAVPALVARGGLMAMARYRSQQQADANRIGHLSSSEMAEMFRERGIQWYAWGENVAYNAERTLAASADRVVRQWQESNRGHCENVMRGRYNYVGLGLVTDTDGRRYWTAVFTESDDVTPPVVTSLTLTRFGTSGSSRWMRVGWTARDAQLSSRTAGLQDVRVRRRPGGGTAWSVGAWRTDTWVTHLLPIGSSWVYQVQARDRKGNLSAWRQIAFTV